MRRALPWIAMIVALASVPARASAQAEPDRSSRLHPFFGVGYSHPITFGVPDRGFGLGLGIEAERSPRLSLLFRNEWNWLRGEYSYVAYDVTYVEKIRLTAIDWSAGARVHFTTEGRIRPYGEACLGVRIIRDPPVSYLTGAASRGFAPDLHRDPEGLALTVRLGAVTRRRQYAGAFFDAGIQFLLGDLTHFDIVPLRLGITLP